MEGPEDAETKRGFNFYAGSDDRIIKLVQHGASFSEILDCFDDFHVFHPELPSAAYRLLEDASMEFKRMLPSAVMSALLPAIFGQQKRRGPTFLVAPSRSGKTTAALFAAAVAAKTAVEDSSQLLSPNPAPSAILVVHSPGDLRAIWKTVARSNAGARKAKVWSFLGLSYRFMLGTVHKENLVDIIMSCDVLCCDPLALSRFLAMMGNFYTDWEKTFVIFDDMDECLRRMPSTMNDLEDTMVSLGVKWHENTAYLARTWTRELDKVWMDFTGFPDIQKSGYVHRQESESDSSIGSSDVAKGCQLVFVKSELACSLFMNVSTTAFYMKEKEKKEHFQGLVQRLLNQDFRVLAIFTKDKRTATLLHAQVEEILKQIDRKNVDVVLASEIGPRQHLLDSESVSLSNKAKIYVWSDAAWAGRSHLSPQCDAVIHWDFGEESSMKGEGNLHSFQRRLGVFRGLWESAYASAAISGHPSSFRASSKMFVYLAVDVENGKAMQAFEAFACPSAASDVNGSDRLYLEDAQQIASRAMEQAEVKKEVCPEFQTFLRCLNPDLSCGRHWLVKDARLETTFPRGSIIKVQCFEVLDGSSYIGVVQLLKRPNERRSLKIYLSNLDYLDDFEDEMQRVVNDSRYKRLPLVKEGDQYALRYHGGKKYYGYFSYRIRVLSVKEVDDGKWLTQPTREYKLLFVDYGVTEILQNKGFSFSFYPLPKAYENTCPLAALFVNTDVLPEGNAPVWRPMGRTLVEEALEEQRRAKGRPGELKGCLGYFCGKVEFAAEGRVYLSRVVATNAVMQGPMPNLRCVLKRELLGWKLVTESEATWREHLPSADEVILDLENKELSIMEKVSAVKATAVSSSSPPFAKPVLGRRLDSGATSVIADGLSIDPPATAVPATSKSVQSKVLSVQSPLETTSLSENLGGDAVENELVVDRHGAPIPDGTTGNGPLQSSVVYPDVPSVNSHPSLDTSSTSSSEDEGVLDKTQIVAWNGLPTPILGCGNGDGVPAALLQSILAKVNQGFIDEDTFKLLAEAMNKIDQDSFHDEDDILPVEPRRMTPPAVKTIPSIELLSNKPLVAVKEPPPAMILRTTLKKGDTWKTPEVEWADLKHFVILEFKLPILYPQMYHVELAGGHFSFFALQDGLYKAVFQFGAPVVHDDDLFDVRVLPDRVNGRITVKIFKEIPESWSYLIQPGEKRKHKWLKFNLRRVEYEEEELKKNEDELEDPVLDLYRKDPLLTFSTRSAIPRDECLKILVNGGDSWELADQCPTDPRGDLANPRELPSDEDSSDEGEERQLCGKPLDMIDEPDESELFEVR